MVAAAGKVTVVVFVGMKVAVAEEQQALRVAERQVLEAGV